MDESTRQLLEMVKQNSQAQLIVVGIAVAFIALYLAFSFWNKRRQNGSQAEALAVELIKQLNGKAKKTIQDDDTHFIPGFSPTCKEHGEKITAVATELPHIKKSIEETKKAVDANSKKTREDFGTVFELLRAIEK